MGEARILSKIKTDSDNTVEPPRETDQDVYNCHQQAVARNYRIRASHEGEMNQLLTVMEKSRAQAEATQRMLEDKLSESHGKAQQAEAKFKELQFSFDRVRSEMTSNKSSADAALRAAETRAANAESELASLKAKMPTEI